jgi:hypothetical protein
MAVIAEIMFVRGTVVGKAKVLIGSVLLLLFCAPFESDQATGGEDDFVRLKHNHDYVTRLEALAAYHPLP